MKRTRIGIALLLIWLLVLGTAAGIPWSAPLWPQQVRMLRGSDFRPVIGAAVEEDGTLGVGGTARDGNALQSIDVNGLDAAELPILTYRFEDFPRTLELTLVFRRADAPNDVQAVLLPWPGDGTRTVDLSALSAWRGEITELGFAEYATAQLVPPSIAFKPFRLVRARLASHSWQALPRLLRTAWFGYQPWNLMSISALGPSINALQTPSMLVPLAVGVLLSILVVAWLRGWAAGRLLRIALVLACFAWIASDLRWLDEFRAKHRLTESIYAGKSWQERARRQPDEDIAGFAQLVRQQLADASSRQRILVGSDSTYTLLRLIWFLLPLNAAPLEQAVNSLPVKDWPQDAVIVLCANTRWHYDEGSSTLRSGNLAIAVSRLFAGGNLAIYRLGGAER